MNKREFLEKLVSMISEDGDDDTPSKPIKTVKMNPKVQLALKDYLKVVGPVRDKAEEAKRLMEEVKDEIEKVSRAKEKFWAAVALYMGYTSENRMTLNHETKEIEIYEQKNDEDDADEGKRIAERLTKTSSKIVRGMKEGNA